MAWHESFFNSPLWQLAQQQAFEPEVSREEAGMIAELLQQMPGARILDLPCGDGRLSLELARRGFEVTGLDRSAPLLEAGRIRAKKDGLNLDLLEGDMWNLDLPAESFDGALCWWSSMGYDSEQNDRDFLSGVGRALRPGASFVLDLQVLETVLPRLHETSWFEAGEILVAEEREYDAPNGRVVGHWNLCGPNSRERLPVSLRIYTVHELLGMLEAAGFGEMDLYGSHGLEPFGDSAERLLLVARKRIAGS